MCLHEITNSLFLLYYFNIKTASSYNCKHLTYALDTYALDTYVLDTYALDTYALSLPNFGMFDLLSYSLI